MLCAIPKGLVMLLPPAAARRLRERFNVSEAELHASLLRLGVAGVRAANDMDALDEAGRLIDCLRRGQGPYVAYCCPLWANRMRPAEADGFLHVVDCPGRKAVYGMALTERELAAMLLRQGLRPAEGHSRAASGPDRLTRVLMAAQALCGEVGQTPAFSPSQRLPGVEECALRLMGRTGRVARVRDKRQARALLGDTQYQVLEILSCAGRCAEN